MEADQRDARIFGVLFILTFLTSIPAALLFQSVLDDPAAYLAGSGNDNQIYLAVLLEFLLILANVGTAVVLYPIARRQSRVLALGYVAARIMECVFIAAGIIFVLGIVSLRQDSPDAADLAVSLAALKDWTALFGPGLVVPFGNGLILGYLMYKSGLVPRRMTWFGLIGGPILLIGNIVTLVDGWGANERVSSSLGGPGVHLGSLPRHLLHDLGFPARLANSAGSQGRISSCLKGPSWSRSRRRPEQTSFRRTRQRGSEDHGEAGRGRATVIGRGDAGPGWPG